MYKKIITTILLIISTCLFLITSSFAVTSSEKQELIDLLNEYKDDLGNLNEFKQCVDKTYNDLHSATKVDENLKNILKEDINSLDTVSNLNPLILTVLKVELNSQVNNLTDETLSEMQEEIAIIKEWTDQQVSSSSNSNNNDSDDNDNNNANNNIIPSKPNNNSVFNNTSNSLMSLPKTGIGITLCIIILISVISIIFSFYKYKNLKGL